MRVVVYFGNIVITGLAFAFIASMFVIDSSLPFGMKVFIELAVAAWGRAIGYRQAKKTEAAKLARVASRASQERPSDRRAPGLARIAATRYLVYSIYIVGTGFILGLLSLIPSNLLGLPTVGRALVQLGAVTGGGVFGYLQAKKNEDVRRVEAARSSSEA